MQFTNFLLNKTEGMLKKQTKNLYRITENSPYINIEIIYANRLKCIS